VTRRGIVLGGGGVLGGTWAIGALCALEQVRGFDVTKADVIVGTSAGSLLAALLGCGVRPESLRDYYRGLPIESGPLAGVEWDPGTATGGARPAMPKGLAPGSLKLIGQSMRHPGQLPATAVLSGFLPSGSRSLDKVGALVESVNRGGNWALHPATWVVSMDYETGKRVVFGRPGAPVARMPEAVMASCAIPGWFAPVRIGGRDYVDGGAVSATSVDVVVHERLDEVYVIAPMVSFERDHPTGFGARLERMWRGQVTSRAIAEAQAVEATGARVRVLGPGPEDLAAIGANLMDADRIENVLEVSLRTSDVAWRQFV